MQTRAAYLIVLSATLPASIIAGTTESSDTRAISPCSRWPKGTTQTSAGMCIDGVLFKDVLQRLSALEAVATSETAPQGKLDD